jgi:hypothetical protein
MKRFEKSVTLKKLHSLAQTIALVLKQTTKSIRTKSFAIETTRFSTKGVRNRSGTQLGGG